MKPIIISFLTAILGLQGITASQYVEALKGTYKGQVFNGDDLDTVVTIFKVAEDGKLHGTYSIEEDVEIGTLSDFLWEGDYTLICSWQDKYGKGTLRVLFSGDLSKFRGFWGSSEKTSNFRWDGTKQATIISGDTTRLTAAIKQHAETCAAALANNDYELFAKYTHPKLVEGLGGKERLILQIKNGMDQMSARGFSIQEVTIGSPGKPKEINSTILSIVPQYHYIKTQAGFIEIDSHLLGISEDAGSTWHFIDLAKVTKAQLHSVFPSFGGELELPPRAKPRFIKGK
jgi:hypothetical protein